MNPSLSTYIILLDLLKQEVELRIYRAYYITCSPLEKEINYSANGLIGKSVLHFYQKLALLFNLKVKQKRDANIHQPSRIKSFSYFALHHSTLCNGS